MNQPTTIEEYEQRAMELFRNGYNCSQAVLLAFCPELNMERETAAAIASSFGGGIGRLREVCGAFSGMAMVAGLKKGYTDPKSREDKARHYQLIQELAERFRRENGSIVCRELLSLPPGADPPVPSERTAEFYKKRPCVELVGCGARIAAEVLGFCQKEQE